MKIPLCVPKTFLVLALASCAAAEGPAPVPTGGMADPVAGVAPVGDEPAPLEQCDAADWRPLIGTSVAAANIAASEALRVYGQGDIITQEYLPGRTNIVHDGEGIIRRVYCG